MTFIRTLSKFVMEVLPLVLASAICAFLLSANQLILRPAAQDRPGADAVEPVVLVHAMPRVNREPERADTVANNPAAAAENPAPAAEPVAPVTAAPRPEAATAPAGRTPRAAKAGRAGPAAIAAPTAPLPPPLPIIPETLTQNPPAPGPARIFGVPVPSPVADVGGVIVGTAKLPVVLAVGAVPPVLRAGGKVVDTIAGAAGAVLSH